MLRGLVHYSTGTLFQITINDLPVGRDVDEALRLVQAFQFVEENGEGKYFDFQISCTYSYKESGPVGKTSFAQVSYTNTAIDSHTR